MNECEFIGYVLCNNIENIYENLYTRRKYSMCSMLKSRKLNNSSPLSYTKHFLLMYFLVAAALANVMRSLANLIN